MPTKKPQKKDSDAHIFAGLIYLVSIFGVIGIILSIVFYLLKKDEQLVKYHFKQWLTLLIFSLVSAAVVAMFAITIIGIVVAIPLGVIVAVVFLILWISGMIHGFSGEFKPLPLIGKYADKFNF